MIRVGILTASDKGAAGQREDKSGQVLKEMVEARGWQVAEYALLPDDRIELEHTMAAWCDEGLVDLLLTTGGTGFSRRDVTPEATKAIGEREVPGIPEAMRFYSLAITKRAMLSRGTAVIRGCTLIVNLPGSPKGARENLEAVMDTLEHGIQILMGEAGECGG